MTTKTDAAATIPEIGKAVERYHTFLSKAHLQRKEYQTEGIQFCLQNELSSQQSRCVRGGIVADEMGLGKTIMMIGLIIANFQKRTLIVLPVALVKQWEQQILRTTGHKALVYYGADKKHITQSMLQEAPVVITTYGHMIRRDIHSTSSVSESTHTPTHRLYQLKWSRVIFDEAHHVRTPHTQIFKSVSTLKADIRWFVTGTPIQNSIRDFYALCSLLGLHSSYYANKDNLREIVKTFVLKRTKKSVGLSLPPLISHTVAVNWASHSEMILSHNLHSGIGCLNISALPDHEQEQEEEPRWFPEPCVAKIGRMIQAKQSCIYPRLACRNSVPKMPDTEDANYCSKISTVVHTIISRKDNMKRKIVFCHFRGEIDIIQTYLNIEDPDLVVRYLDGRTNENERRKILAPDAEIDVLILQIQTCCEGLNLQQFSEVYFVSPDWNPSVEDQAIARCHRFGQTEPVIVFRFIMAPFQLQFSHTDAEVVDASAPQTEHPQLDTIETYTANIQNKKRIFADEVLNI
jgi:SNF2 family DNA or RNA helicase